ncbi:DUF6631 family protein [Ectopseudomonas toyotomiensis]|nr:DUF6631 family protein [Pseudomonas toyotomiensis]
MGARVARKPKEEQGANDLEVLHPNRSATIAEREVVVREYGFVEGMQMLAMLEPLLVDLQDMMANTKPLDFHSSSTLFAKHMEIITYAIAVSADVEVEWLGQLNQEDGYHLLMLWWGVNGPFYIRTVRDRVIVERAAAQSAAKAGAGQTSTPPSSPQAMETPNASES